MASDITRWKWHAAWAPDRTVLAGFLLGFVVAATALLPLGILVKTGAVYAVLVGPLVGALGGYLVWRRARTYVDDRARAVLEERYAAQSPGRADVWLTPLAGTGSTDHFDVAPTYEFTRVERTPEEVRMSDVTVDMTTLETTERTTVVPAGKVNAVAVEDGTLVVDARTGIWRFENVSRAD